MTADQTNATAQKFNLGEMDQIGIIVRNMDEALPSYEALFGKFHVITPPRMPVNYRGEDSSQELKIAFGRAGSLEIELIEPIDGPLYSEHLQRHGEGMHHFRFKVENLDDTLQAMEADGYSTVISSDTKTIRFAYVESPEKLGHTLLELIEGMSGGTAE